MRIAKHLIRVQTPADFHYNTKYNKHLPITQIKIFVIFSNIRDLRIVLLKVDQKSYSLGVKALLSPGES